MAIIWQYMAIRLYEGSFMGTKERCSSAPLMHDGALVGALAKLKLAFSLEVLVGGMKSRSQNLKWLLGELKQGRGLWRPQMWA